MYLSYFGLSSLPFSISPDTRFLYLTPKHQEALALLVYGLTQGNGLVLLTGEIGTGKTTVLRHLFSQLPANTKIALILNPKLSEIELLETLCDELRIHYDRKTPSLKNRLDALNAYLLKSYQEGIHTVLVIDEAQHLSHELLESIRLLTNLETEKRKLLQIVLVGQPELREILMHPALVQVAQRVVARYHLKPLSRRETKGYVLHRLKVAGLSAPLFSARAYRRIFFLTRGIPRLINVLCERCLLAAFATESRRIKPTLIEKASREVFGFKKKQKRFGWKLIVLIGLFIGAMGAVLWRSDQAFFFHWGSEFFSQSQNDFDSVLSLASQDKKQAEKILLAFFGLPWSEQNAKSGCDLEKMDGYYCYTEQTTWDKIRYRNEPGIMILYDKRGVPHYAVLLALVGNKAIFALGGIRHEENLERINPYWKGEWQGLLLAGDPNRKPPYLIQALP